MGGGSGGTRQQVREKNAAPKAGRGNPYVETLKWKSLLYVETLTWKPLRGSPYVETPIRAAASISAAAAYSTWALHAVGRLHKIWKTLPILPTAGGLLALFLFIFVWIPRYLCI